MRRPLILFCRRRQVARQRMQAVHQRPAEILELADACGLLGHHVIQLLDGMLLVSHLGLDFNDSFFIHDAVPGRQACF